MFEFRNWQHLALALMTLHTLRLPVATALVVCSQPSIDIALTLTRCAALESLQLQTAALAKPCFAWLLLLLLAGLLLCFFIKQGSLLVLAAVVSPSLSLFAAVVCNKIYCNCILPFTSRRYSQF